MRQLFNFLFFSQFFLSCNFKSGEDLIVEGIKEMAHTNRFSDISEKCFKEAIEKKGSNTFLLHFHRAQNFEKLRNADGYGKAIDSYKTALEFKMKNDTLNMIIAGCYKRIQQQDSALKYCDQAILSNNEYLNAHLFRHSLLYYDIKDYSKVIDEGLKIISMKEFKDEYSKCKDLKSDDYSLVQLSELISKTAYSFQYQMDTLSGINYLERCIDLFPNLPRIYITLSILYSNANFKDNELGVLNRLLENYPDFAEGYYYRFLARTINTDYDYSLMCADLTRAVDLKCDQAIDYYNKNKPCKDFN